MKKEYYTLIALMLMISGEALSIYSELYSSRLPQSFSQDPIIFLKPMMLITIGGLCLVLSYWMGYRGTGNIWIVTVASLTLLLILEPIIIFIMFRQIPARGAAVGFVLGALGLIATVVL